MWNNRKVGFIEGHELGKEIGSGRENLEEIFITDKEKKGISAKMIDDYARKLAEIYQSKKENFLDDDLSIITDALSNERIFDLIEISNTSINTNDRDIILNVIGQIRRAVLKSLLKYIDSKQVFLIEKYFKNARYYGDVFVLDAYGTGKDRQLVGKRPYALDISLYKDPKKRDATIRAIKKYQGLSLHPNIVPLQKPSVVDVNDAKNPSDLAINLLVSPLLKMRTLKDMHDGELSKDVKINVSDIINIFINYVDALLFLEKNGLVLQDIKAENLGVNLENMQGILFDLEGLYPLGEPRLNRYGQWENFPPEVESSPAGIPVKVMSKEMVYQLGLSLITVCKRNVDIFPKEDGVSWVFQDVITLAREMIKHDSILRPSLKQVKKRLEKLKQSL